MAVTREMLFALVASLTLILGFRPVAGSSLPAYQNTTTPVAQPSSACTGCIFGADSTSTLSFTGVVETYTTATILPIVTIFEDGSLPETHYSTITTAVTSVFNATNTTGSTFTDIAHITWIVDGVTLTYPTTYVQYIQFAGAPYTNSYETLAQATSTKCTAFPSIVELPSSADAASFIIPLPKNVSAPVTTVPTTLLQYLDSFATISQQFFGEPLTNCASVLSTGTTELSTVETSASALVHATASMLTAYTSPASTITASKNEPPSPLGVPPTIASTPRPSANPISNPPAGGSPAGNPPTSNIPAGNPPENHPPISKSSVGNSPGSNPPEPPAPSPAPSPALSPPSTPNPSNQPNEHPTVNGSPKQGSARPVATPGPNIAPFLTALSSLAHQSNLSPAGPNVTPVESIPKSVSANNPNSGPVGPKPTTPPAITNGGGAVPIPPVESIAVTANSNGDVVLGGHTLSGGSTITFGSGASMTTAALQTSGGQTQLVIGTSTLPVVPPSITNGGGAVPISPVSIAFTANSYGDVVLGGHTLNGGSTTTFGSGVSMTTAALQTSGGKTQLVIGTSTFPVVPPLSATSNAPILVIGGTTYEPQSGSVYAIGGETLTLGHAITEGGNTISIDSSGNTLVINGQTRPVVQGQTLSSGGTILVSGTMTLAAGGTTSTGLGGYIISGLAGPTSTVEGSSPAYTGPAFIGGANGNDVLVLQTLGFVGAIGALLII